jgi:5-methyltetrahydrofolate--homocysteine methyltransferase
MSDFLTALRSSRILLMDGAMGTQLQSAGIGDGECYEAWNLTQPEKIRAIHRSYVEAGAEILVANTFQANPQALARHRQENNLTAILSAGLGHARSALTSGGWVLASIGPLATMDSLTVTAIVKSCLEADGILLETFSDPAEAATFARAAQSASGALLPILVSFTFDGKSLRTFRNVTPTECALAASSMGASALGVNCGRDLDLRACAEILKAYRSATQLPLFARPNAGSLSVAKDYPRVPEEMADQLPMLLQAGATMIGGCCGTSPAHIGAFRAVVDAWNSGKTKP